jgi:hypothetical protein
VAEVGARTEYRKIALTTNSAIFKDQIGEASVPGPGMRFLVANVKIENNTEYKLIYNRYQFTVQAPSGAVLNAVAVPGESSPLQNSTVDPQKDVTGNITFKVPDGVTDFTLRYQVPGSVDPILVALTPTEPTPLNLEDKAEGSQDGLP